jgi:hypothetical protein
LGGLLIVDVEVCGVLEDFLKKERKKERGLFKKMNKTIRA